MHKRYSPHGDYDHMGEAINLVENFKVETGIDEWKIIEALNLRNCVKSLDEPLGKEFIEVL